MSHFKEDSLLYFYSNIEKDIINLFKIEYSKLKSEIKGKTTIMDSNISFDELTQDIYEDKTKKSKSTINRFFIPKNNQQDEYLIYLNEINESHEIDPLLY